MVGNRAVYPVRLLYMARYWNRSVSTTSITTKPGKIAGVLLAPDHELDAVKQLHGFMRGSVVVPEDVDLKAAIAEEAFATEDGLPQA